MFVVSSASLRTSSLSRSPFGIGVRFLTSTPTRTGTAFDKCSISEIKNSADILGFPKKNIKHIKREMPGSECHPREPANLILSSFFKIKFPRKPRIFFKSEIKKSSSNECPNDHAGSETAPYFPCRIALPKGGTAGVPGGDG